MDKPRHQDRTTNEGKEAGVEFLAVDAPFLTKVRLDINQRAAASRLEEAVIARPEAAAAEIVALRAYVAPASKAAPEVEFLSADSQSLAEVRLDFNQRTAAGRLEEVVIDRPEAAAAEIVGLRAQALVAASREFFKELDAEMDTRAASRRRRRKPR